MQNHIDRAIARTLLQAMDFAVTNRRPPAWLEEQLRAAEAMSVDASRGLALYIQGLQAEREAIEALENKWK